MGDSPGYSVGSAQPEAAIGCSQAFETHLGGVFFLSLSCAVQIAQLSRPAHN